MSTLTLLITGELLLLRSLVTTAANGLGNAAASSRRSSLPRLLLRPTLSTKLTAVAFTPASGLDRWLDGLVAAAGPTSTSRGASAGLVALELRPPRDSNCSGVSSSSWSATTRLTSVTLVGGGVWPRLGGLRAPRGSASRTGASTASSASPRTPPARGRVEPALGPRRREARAASASPTASGRLPSRRRRAGTSSSRRPPASRPCAPRRYAEGAGGSDGGVGLRRYCWSEGSGASRMMLNSPAAPACASIISSMRAIASRAAAARPAPPPEERRPSIR
jgi:hypothetical protein